MKTAARGRQEGSVMGFYDYECDLIRADERFICQCMKCGQERLKKLSVCMLRREGSGIVKTIGYLCPVCYAQQMDGWAVPE